MAVPTRWKAGASGGRGKHDVGGLGWRPAESTAANLAPKMVGQSFVCGKWMGVGVGKPASCCLPGSGHFWESGAQKTSKMVLKTFPKCPK